MKPTELKNLIRKEVRKTLKEAYQNDLYVVWIQTEEGGAKKAMYTVPKNKAMTAANNLYNRYKDDYYLNLGITPKDVWDAENK
jgi:hypothetical protein